MNPEERGRHIIAAAKSLKAYRLDDPGIAATLYATWFAGRAGLLLSAIRHHHDLPYGRFVLLASNEAFGPLDIRNSILPWLEDQSLCRVIRQDKDVISVESLVLSYSDILSAVSDLYDELDPTAEDQGCLMALEVASRLPSTRSEVMQQLATELGDEKAEASLKLACSYKIVSSFQRGGREPLIYSERLWASAIDKAAPALSGLDATQRALIMEFLNRVRRYQGMPEAMLRRFASDQNAEQLLDIAIGIGLLNRTELTMADGTVRPFLTSPHFYGELADEHGEDMCDRVKIFLDSIRNGQHFGNRSTGQILYPEALLRKFINTGELGAVTAIGTDYVTSEMAGIVRVRRGVAGGRATMELVQEDTVRKVLEVVSTGRVEGSAPMGSANVREGVRFRSIEQQRAQMGDVPESIAEIERDIVRRLREG